MKLHGPTFAVVALIVVSVFYMRDSLEVSFINSEAFNEAISTQKMEQWHSYRELVDAGQIPPHEPIFEFFFSHNAFQESSLTLDGIVKKNGYPSRFEKTPEAYKIKFFDVDGDIVYEQFFVIPMEGEKIKLATPWFGEAILMEVSDDSNRIVVRQTLSRIPFDNSEPIFFINEFDN